MMKKATSKQAVLSVKIDAGLKRRMDEVAGAGPYRVSITSIVERGVELALKELCAARPGKAGRHA